MSKRYGRNQKRRHRAEIARLAEEGEALLRRVQMETTLSEHLGRELDRARESIREMVEAIEAVCPCSVTLPAKGIRGEGEKSRLQVEMQEGPAMSQSPMSKIVPDRLTFRMVDVYRLEAFLRENIENFTAAVHLVYEDAAGRRPAAYMISRQALETMPEERILRQLLPEVGRRLLAMVRGR